MTETSTTTIPEWRNPVWNHLGGLDLEINHPKFGWIPYSTIDGSGETEAQAIYDAVLASDTTPESFVAPEPSGFNVNDERERRILEGTTFDITGYGPIRLQGDPDTVQNLNSLALKSNILIAQGNGDQVTNYRDADNIVHPITQPQLLELWSKAGAYIEACYEASWALKDNGPIPKDFSDDAYWP